MILTAFNDIHSVNVLNTFNTLCCQCENPLQQGLVGPAICLQFNLNNP